MILSPGGFCRGVHLKHGSPLADGFPNGGRDESAAREVLVRCAHVAPSDRESGIGAMEMALSDPRR